jgi:pSer/pThr/pTyr-binding forkhead associated (FHA) protein
VLRFPRFGKANLAGMGFDPSMTKYPPTEERGHTMKLSLVVLTPGKGQGKVIPLTLAQFLIGRDPQCHLRPANPLISKRHCAVLVRGEQAFLKDFDSTNGTVLNGEPLKGEREIRDGDRFRVGPLEFQVRFEARVAVDKSTPIPPTRTAVKPDEDEAAALLLSLHDSVPEPEQNGASDVVEGSTQMEVPAAQPSEEQPASANGKTPGQKSASEKAADTASAAAVILGKYIRRPRI